MIKTKLPSEITTVAQAELFLTELHKNNEAYHPEDNAADCVGHIATNEQCDLLDKLMEDIYNLDGNNGNHKNPSFDPCQFILDIK